MANPKDDPESDDLFNPNRIVKIKYEDILSASLRLSGFVNRTQCPLAHMSEKLGVELYMKQEFLQYTGWLIGNLGDFFHDVIVCTLFNNEERGVRNAMMLLNEDQKRFGVITASSGNHGTAVTYHASKLGIPCTVVMPLLTSMDKRSNTERHGGLVLFHGGNIAEAQIHALTLAKEKRMMYLDGFDHPHVIEGQGTIGIEIINQVPDVDAVLVPCGGGSLLAGIAIAVKHLKPTTEIYGIETDKTCSMAESFKKNERVFFPTGSTIADGLSVSKVGINTFYNLKGLVKRMIVVNEDWVTRAIMHVIEDEKFNIEGAGAVGIAALMSGLLPNLKGKKVVAVISGGNIDSVTLGRALDRGMAVEGRLVKFKVSVSDKPGGLAEMCRRLAGLGIIVRDCVPERACTGPDIFNIQFKMICETRGWNHTKQLVHVIKKHYKDYLFQEMNDKTPKPVYKKRGPCLAPNPVCMQ